MKIILLLNNYSHPQFMTVEFRRGIITFRNIENLQGHTCLYESAQSAYDIVFQAVSKMNSRFNMLKRMAHDNKDEVM